MPSRTKGYFNALQRSKNGGYQPKDTDGPRLSNGVIAFFIFVVVGSSVFQLLRSVGFS